MEQVQTQSATAAHTGTNASSSVARRMPSRSTSAGGDSSMRKHSATASSTSASCGPKEFFNGIQLRRRLAATTCMNERQDKVRVPSVPSGVSAALPEIPSIPCWPITHSHMKTNNQQPEIVVASTRDVPQCTTQHLPSCRQDAHRTSVQAHRFDQSAAILLHFARHGLRHGPVHDRVAVGPLEAVRLPLNEVDQTLRPQASFCLAIVHTRTDRRNRSMLQL